MQVLTEERKKMLEQAGVQKDVVRFLEEQDIPMLHEWSFLCAMDGMSAEDIKRVCREAGKQRSQASGIFMEERDIAYHWDVPKTVGGETYHILRHTPKDKQKLALYAPMFNEAKALVLPEIFNPDYLSIDNYEGVSFWQAKSNRMGINITPAIIEADPTDPAYGTQKAGSAVSLDYVVGCLFDEDAVLAEMQIQRADTTTLEARKHYRNTWNTFTKNAISDPTEKFILFYMAS